MNPIETMAEAMREKGAWCGGCTYGERYPDDDGNDQPCTECISITEEYARAALSALLPEAGREEARRAGVRAYVEHPFDGQVTPLVESILDAAAPLLLAPLLAEIETVKGERDLLEVKWSNADHDLERLRDDNAELRRKNLVLYQSLAGFTGNA